MNDLEEIKQKIDIVSFIGDYLPLKKSGRNFTGLCPFHSEKSPSFVVSPERQIWHCFGACSEGGDVFTFLMKIENLEFPEALEILAKKTGVKLVRQYRVTQNQKLKEEILKANQYAGNFYHYLLTSHKVGEKARGYLEQRKISKKIIDTFSLGYAPQNWDSLLNFLRKKGFNDYVLQKAGLVIQARTNRFYDRFRGRLMFALRDHRGEVIGFSGRKLLGDNKDKEAKYINTAETPVYIKGNLFYGLDITKEAIRKANQAIIVEGEFDLLSSFQEGITNVVAIKGTALTVNQVNLIKRFTDTISFSLDSDIAGDAAARRGIEIAENAGLNLKVISVPLGKDPDECIKENPAVWRKAVQESISVYDFLLNSALKRFNINEAFGKKKIVDEILPFYGKITNSIVQSHYLSLLSKTINVSEERVLEVLDKMKKGRPQTATLPALTNEGKKRNILLEEYLLSFLLQAPAIKQITEVISKEELTKISWAIENPALKKLIALFYNWIEKLKNEEPQSPQFIKTLPNELIPIADKAYLFELGETVKEKKLFKQELEQTKHDLLLLALRRRMRELSTKTREAKDESILNPLNREFNDLKLQLKELDRKPIK